MTGSVLINVVSSKNQLYKPSFNIYNQVTKNIRKDIYSASLKTDTEIYTCN